MNDEKVLITGQPLPKHIAFSQTLAANTTMSLSDSTGQALTFAELCHLTGRDINNTLLQYAPVQGALPLRHGIADFHHQLNCHRSKLDAENVVTFCGAQEALSAIYQTLLRAGDEIVVVTPSYPSLVTMARSMAVTVREVRLRAEHNWQVTIDDFTQVVNEKTRLIVLNSPHNPTGSIIDTKLAQQILQLAQTYQCYLLSDDVSQASNYHQLALAHGYLDYPKSIVVGVMSKSFGLAGLRIGWALTPNIAVLQNLIAIKAAQSICCSKIDETLACLALQKSREILAVNNQIVRDNIAIFSDFIARYSHQFSWQPPQAGILALVEVKNIDSITAWSKNLAKHAGILALPSELFGLPGNYFRLGLGQKSFAQTLEKFEHYLLTTNTTSAVTD